MIVLRILFCDPQCLRGYLSQRHPSVFNLGRNGKANASGTGAEIQYPGILHPQLHLMNRKVADRLRIISWDQHIRRYRQGEPIELPLSQNIGQRFTF